MSPMDQGTLNGSASPVHERMVDQMDQVRDALSDINQRASTFIRARPGLCLAAAIGIGFLAGRLVSRR